MGAKQSKRSVDISGKEAESAGEVAAGAGGEGRVEQLADADALKPQQPQLNGDAHIHDASEKEKQLDSGTPENEKDATTEKEGKEKEQEDEKDKESSVLTNGDSEQKPENAESTPSPEDSKKPKKEKVKKKWSLRSISFSRKDKPKQEKKQKEEQAKTNGEPEKVEEAAETSPEKETNGVIQEDKSESETRDEKTPETPVTEPITNGSSTPETPKEETPVADEPTNASEEKERTETTKNEVEPEQLPVNGLTLEEPKVETAEPVDTVASKAEETVVEKPEPVPATEIPDKNEVCVDKSPLIEPSPPPLPANPPPSSVASFAATTMAPELTDASLANTAEITSNAARIDTPETNSELIAESVSSDVPNTQSAVEPEIDTVVDTEVKHVATFESNTGVHEKAPIDSTHVNDIHSDAPEPVSVDIPEETNNLENNVSDDNVALNDVADIINEVESLNNDQKIPETPVDDLPEPIVTSDNIEDGDKIEKDAQETKPLERDINVIPDNNVNGEQLDTVESVTPVSQVIDSENVLKESTEALKDNSEIKKKTIESAQMEATECNGRVEDEKILTNGEATPMIDDATDSVPVVTPEESEASGDAAGGVDILPPPPSDLVDAVPQELISVSDKMSELIPEVPSVPEIKTELETTTDVAVAN